MIRNTGKITLENDCKNSNARYYYKVTKNTARSDIAYLPEYNISSHSLEINASTE